MSPYKFLSSIAAQRDCSLPNYVGARLKIKKSLASKLVDAVGPDAPILLLLNWTLVSIAVPFAFFFTEWNRVMGLEIREKNEWNY